MGGCASKPKDADLQRHLHSRLIEVPATPEDKSHAQPHTIANDKDDGAGEKTHNDNAAAAPVAVAEAAAAAAPPPLVDLSDEPKQEAPSTPAEAAQVAALTVDKVEAIAKESEDKTTEASSTKEKEKEKEVEGQQPKAAADAAASAKSDATPISSEDKTGVAVAAIVAA